MKAMVLTQQKSPLQLTELSVPSPGRGQVLLKVLACGVCRTDLHILDGELTDPKLPLILGHQIVGEVVQVGEGVNPDVIGKRLGVPWLAKTCGVCHFCKTNRENLCDNPEFTGYTVNGGFAEYAVANYEYAFAIPKQYDDVHAAPLLCPGLIGYRSYRMAGDGKKLGLYGFGAAAHILTQVAVSEGKDVYAFTRDGDEKTQIFALEQGARWVGNSHDILPEPLDAAILFAPVGELVPVALRLVNKGCPVVCAGIHMSDIPSFPYQILWEERIVRSVANLTRQDGRDFFALADKIPIQTTVTTYPLEKANEALEDLRAGRFDGSAVIKLAV
jgi:propanol-preferring alcohol dehydrogenase